MTSHTGAGTYFAMISSFLILYGYETHKKPFLLLGLMVFLPIFGSASREGLIASFTVFLWYVLKYFKLKRFIYFVMVLFMLGATLMLTSQHAYEKTRRMFSWDLMVRMQRAFENSHWQPEDRSDREFEGSEWNILSRMLFWSYAIKRFKESPVIGVGFGRHNDHYLKLYGSPGLVYLALEGKKRLTVGSAHNSYLHILEESGVVGLTLLIWLWVPIYIRLTKAEKLFRVFPEIRAYYIASQGLVIFTLVAACFGHALAAPSITAPVLTVVSMGIAHQRKFIEDKWLRENQLTRIDEEIK
jgi:O-antigen ligase